jgi:hypothetical protein
MHACIAPTARKNIQKPKRRIFFSQAAIKGDHYG